MIELALTKFWNRCTKIVQWEFWAEIQFTRKIPKQPCNHRTSVTETFIDYVNRPTTDKNDIIVTSIERLWKMVL